MGHFVSLHAAELRHRGGFRDKAAKAAPRWNEMRGLRRISASFFARILPRGVRRNPLAGFHLERDTQAPAKYASMHPNLHAPGSFVPKQANRGGCGTKLPEMLGGARIG